MPDGSGCVALCHPMKGATPEMIDWWFAWHGLEDLRYKLWYPEMHVSARLDPEERAKVLDPKRSLPQKFQGLTHHVVEDIGGGVFNAVDISFLTPEEFGFDMDRFKPPNVEALAAANVMARGVDDPKDGPGLPVAFVHLVRKTDEGIEVRNRFWVGYQIVDKKPVLDAAPGHAHPRGSGPGPVPARRPGVRQPGRPSCRSSTRRWKARWHEPGGARGPAPSRSPPTPSRIPPSRRPWPATWSSSARVSPGPRRP